MNNVSVMVPIVPVTGTRRAAVVAFPASDWPILCRCLTVLTEETSEFLLKLINKEPD